ncbi:MAG: lytic murein transglycosylase B [Steroidobacteraceae bacterium]
MRRWGFLSAGLVAASIATPALSADKPVRFDIDRPEIRTFISEVSTRNSLDAQALAKLLAQAERQSSILEAMTRPAEQALPWWQYRARFLSTERIEAGLRYWAQHKPLLERIAAERGVPPHYLLAILGIETFYGRNTGRYRLVDSLATLAFDYPPRAKFFTGELEQLLLLARDEQLDPLTLRGSYAGAMGVPQFISSSYRNYAIDGDGNGHRDLWNDTADVLASVANYFVEYGWQRGEPVMADVTTAANVERSGDDPAVPRPSGLNDTVGSLRARGHVFATSLPDSAPAMLVAAELETGVSWRVGFRNFHTITRYNRSNRYAMAVNDLAQALAGAMSLPPAPGEGN